MTTRDIELNIKNQFAGKQDKHEPFRAVITDSAGNQTGTNSVWRDENRRLVYYRPLGSGAVAVALCDRIEPLIGLGVYIQFSDLIDQYEVLRDDPAQRSATSNRRSYLITVKDDLERGGQQQFWIEDEMLQNLAVNPQSTGLIVDVGPGDYDYFGTRKTFTGEASVDLSGNQPAGPNEHRLVGLYIDGSNALQTVNGTVTTNDVAAAEPTWPTGSFRLATVDLDESQTTISISADIKSRKVLWGESESGSKFPKTGEINLNGVIYTDFSEAAAASVANDIMIMGSGTFAETANVTINHDLIIQAQGRTSTILIFTGVTEGITITGATTEVELRQITLTASNTGADCKAIVCDDGGSLRSFESYIAAVVSGSGTAYGAYIDTTGTGGEIAGRFTSFFGLLGSTDNYGIYVANNSSSNCNLTACIVTGSTKSVSIQNGQYSFVGDVFSGGGLEVIASTSEYGYYYYSTLTVWDGSAWVDMPTVGDWTDFTPTVTQSGSVTVTVNYARYKLVDDLCTMQVKLSVTGSGTANNAIVIAGLPAAAQPANIGLLGTFLVDDNGTALYQGALRASGADDLRFIVHNATGFVGVVPNFGLANGDTIWLEARYEV